MNFCINKSTLEVVEKEYAWSSSDGWEIYPYDEYTPETHHLKCSNGIDRESGDIVENLICSHKTVQEITDDLKAVESRCHYLNKEFDYISFDVERIEEELDTCVFIVPKGVYRPTKERALAWYKEKIKKEALKIDSRKKHLLMQLENNKKSIESITKQLEELNGGGE